MSRLLVVYGTTDGQTAKIAQFLGDELRMLGAHVDVAEAGAAWPNPLDFDGVLVAASIHGGRYQRNVIRWTRVHARGLHQRPTAFLSVCLAVLQGDTETQKDLAAIVDRFVRETGWVPAERKHVAGALKYTRYGWVKRMLMRWIARRAGGAVDTSRDHEYTDWADLRNFAAAFLARCTTAVPVEPAARPREAAPAGA